MNKRPFARFQLLKKENPMLSKISQAEVHEALKEFFQNGGTVEELPPEEEPRRQTVGVQKKWLYEEAWWE